MRLIDADEAKNYLYEHLDDLHMIAAQNAIDEMPTIDAQPVKRGKWLMHSVEFGDFEGEQTRLKNIEIQTAKCSECGKWVEQVNHIIWSMPFCANCGARMDGSDAK